eukprot:SAG11_NODE_35227_length_267_cov_1.529762_1_plen_34_part_10
MHFKWLVQMGQADQTAAEGSPSKFGELFYCEAPG